VSARTHSYAGEIYMTAGGGSMFCFIPDFSRGEFPRCLAVSIAPPPRLMWTRETLARSVGLLLTPPCPGRTVMLRDEAPSADQKVPHRLYLFRDLLVIGRHKEPNRTAALLGPLVRIRDQRGAPQVHDL